MMDEEDKRTLEHISETLDKVLVVLQKPGNRFLRILDIAAAGMGVLGALTVVDTVIKWVTGGN